MGKARPRKKGYRQGHMKKFHGEYINAGESYRPQSAAHAYDVYSALRRARSLGAPEPTAKDVRRSNYETNKEFFQQTMAVDSDEVLEKLKGLWQGDFWQGVDRFFKVNLILSEERNLLLFFARDCWFFVAEYPKKKMAKRSIVYSSRAMAMMHLEHGRITWIEKKDLRIPLLDGLPPASR
jgi:hypothetical protein